jgi:hypothetical protein
MRALAVPVACSVAACGKGGPSAADLAAKIDVGPVNAAVPEALAGRLSFAAQAVDESMGKRKKDPVAPAPVPVGWTPDDILPGRFKPPRVDKFDPNEYSVSTTCQGECKGRSAADWKAVNDKDLFAQFSGGSFKVGKDEDLGDGRLVVATTERMGDEVVHVVLARWRDGAARTLWCTAELAGDWRPAAAAFELACRAAEMAQ